MRRAAWGIRWATVVAVSAVTGAAGAAGAVPGRAEGEAAGAGGEPAAASPSATVGLVLAAEDRTPVPGEEAVFRATVANGGETPVEGALLAQHVPEELAIVETGGGFLEGGVVNWRVDVPRGEEAGFTLRVRVPAGAVAGDRLRSTACLLVDRDADPTSCASDTLVVGEPTVMSRVDAFVGAGSVRVAGAVLGLALVWLLWRARGASSP